MNLIKILVIFSIFCAGTILQASNSNTISYEDIIKFSKPTLIKVSPDGSKIAYVLQNGVIEDNATVDTIYFYDIKKKNHILVAKTSSIIQIEWDEQNKDLYVLSKEKNDYQIAIRSPETHKLLVSSKDPLTAFQVNAAHNSLIYTSTRYDSKDVVQKRLENGYVYQWKEDSILTLCTGSYRKKICEEVVLMDLSSGTKQKVTEIGYNTFWNDDGDLVVKLINKIAISPNNRYFAFEAYRHGQVELGEVPLSKEIFIWDNLAHSWIHPPGKSLFGTKANPCWIGNQKLVFQLESTSDYTCKIFLFDCDLQKETPLNFSKNFPPFDTIVFNNKKNQCIGLTDTQATSFSINDNSSEIVDFPENIVPKNPCIPPSIDCNGRYLASCCESSNVAPEIGMYDFENNKSQPVSHLNPWLGEKQLGNVETLSFSTKNGIQSTGYLVHPVNEKANVRYPLIVAAFGFRGGFVLDAEWHTTFPSQVLAAQGYLVLLLNMAPGITQNLVGNPVQAMKNEGWNNLELFEHAVDTLVEKGLADPTKVGMYGWSHGGFITNFLIAHSTKFQAACYGEGADYNPSEYWLGGDDQWAKILDNTFGGPPWGKTLTNYQNFCSFFNVEKINTPVLMEYADIGCRGYEFEMYVPLRILHKPAELIFYKDEKHNFVRPKARLSSMKRKVDWFNYWLLGKKDSNSEFQEQYERWDAMKKEFEANSKYHSALLGKV